MLFRYVVVEQFVDEQTKQLPILFAHAWSDEQIRAGVEAMAPGAKVLANGVAKFITNIVTCEGLGTAFPKGSRGRIDEILIASAAHL